MKESELQDLVVDAARLGGWRVAHFGAARTVHGWRTPARVDGAGFPDLILARPDSPLLAWELKSASGRVAAEQAAWIDVLGQTTAPEAAVIRPDDLDWVVNKLVTRRRSDREK